MKDAIIKILKENVDDLADVDINSSTKLIDGGYVDSFDIINLLSVLEKKFDVSIPIDDLKLESFNSVDFICGLIEDLIKKRNHND